MKIRKLFSVFAPLRSLVLVLPHRLYRWINADTNSYNLS